MIVSGDWFPRSRVINKTGHGPGRDCLLGIVGAIVGGCSIQLLGNARGPGWIFIASW